MDEERRKRSCTTRVYLLELRVGRSRAAAHVDFEILNCTKHVILLDLILVVQPSFARNSLYNQGLHNQKIL